MYGTREYVVTHSTVLSRAALVLLAEAVINLLAGRDRAMCAWEEEPGQYRWVLARDGEQVVATILWFPDAFSPLSDDRGTIEFTFACPLRRLAVQVKNIHLAKGEDTPSGLYLNTAIGKLDIQLRQ